MMPDPKCPDCKGTGEILLFVRTVKCFCLNRIIDDDPLELKKLFDERLKENNDINWPII
jgi:hypothetical protein